MNFQKRKKIILDVLEKNGEAGVAELAVLCGTSEITIRRDLTQLATEGRLDRTHGGAMKAGPAKPPFAFHHKNTARAEAKEFIGQLAASQVQNGEVIFMDCGSTVYRMCPYLRQKDIVVITNSLPVVHELLGSRCKINLIGGELDADRQAVHGRMAEEHISRYQVDRAFVGADGVSVKQGLSAGSEREAGITLGMANHARRVYLLCDESKLNQSRYLSFAPLSLVDVLVTNARGEEIRTFENAGLIILNL